MTRRLFLVRHGETEGQSSIRFNGSTDVDLSDLGRSQIGALVPLLRDEKFAAVVHSPMSRARESASILIDGLRTRPPVVEVEQDLREIDFGVIERMTAEEIEAAMPEWYRRWRANEITAFPEGDSIEEFRTRAGRAVERCVARHPHGDLLVVAHQGVVKAGIAALCGVAPEEIRRWDMALGSLWVLRAMETWVLERQNEVG